VVTRGAIGPLALLVVSLLAAAAVVWGWLVANPQFDVLVLDAGPADQLAVGRVTPFPEVDVYLLGLADGRVRALDGVVRASGCSVRWLADDQRPREADSRRGPGAFLDPCTGAVWAATGDAISGTSEPLRTFRVTFQQGEDGVQHMYVDVVGRDRLAGPDGG